MIRYEGKTDTGRTRDHNEDFFLLPPADAHPERSGYFFVLCDGMGGANAGEVASEKATRWLMSDYYAAPETAPVDLVRTVNRRLYDLSVMNPEYRGMGTTMVSVLFRDEKATVCSVGDSRVYRFREQTLEQLTEDQSEVWELYRTGRLSKDELRFHPRNNIITQVLGVQRELAVEHIQVVEETLHDGDLFLLCSDGLTDMISEEEIRTILLGPADAQVAVLVEAANAAGGRDNITVVVAAV